MDTTEDVNFETEHPETGCQYSNNSSYVMVQRHVDNAKERNRNKNVNTAFSTLRTLIPTEPRDRKLSKIETLRLATSYIVHLANIIRARTEGDFGDQVCERYGCLFTDEVNLAANQKHICTFCLTDGRRNFLRDQFLRDKSKGSAAVLTPNMQTDILLSQQPQKQVLSLHNHFDEKVIEKLQQNRQYIVKKEI